MSEVTRTVTVLQDDIDNGQRRSNETCAIARACWRDLADLLDDGTYLHVGAEFLAETGDGRELFAYLPEEARVFIRNFDRGDKRAKPFKLELTLHVTAEE